MSNVLSEQNKQQVIALGRRTTAAGAPASSRRPGGNSPALRLFLRKSVIPKVGRNKIWKRRSAGGVFGQHVIRHYRPAAQAFGQHLNSTLPSAVWKHWRTKSRALSPCNYDID